MELPIRSHTKPCVCRSKVADVPQIGAMLWSPSEVVAFKLSQLQEDPTAEGQPTRFTGNGWQIRVNAFLGELSRIERGEVHAAPVAADGSFQPWTAVPAEMFMDRQKSTWLPKLLNDNAMFPYYQPILDVTSGLTIGFEALMRATVDGRLVNGGELVDASRAHNALFQFDQKARTCAIRHAATRVHAGELLFINFIPMVIYDPAICLKTTWETAKEFGWPMDKLVFEVIESEAFPDIDHLRTILDAYREQGCQVALDDLGTGRTALTYIDELRPDIIKLAKGLLPDRPRQDDLGMLRGLVEHARNRNITTLIEGVETPEQLAVVQQLGIDLVQGYLTGKPAAEPVRSVQLLKRAA
ncbi:MAG: EAL domain-containing protein [Pyrinomonadaceae bacterium]|nr:EAL domain-containing protein [Phycisphaerales bacterium]